MVQFDISNPESPEVVRVYPDIKSEDVIIRENLLIVTGSDGIYQFDCSADSLQQLSFLPLSL
jgi:hypothetical protein